MIPRYSRPEMAAVWAPETRFSIWLEIERHALDAQVALGQAPQEAADALARAIDAHPEALVDPAKIDAIERETRHDVIAFLTNLANHVGPEARFIHQGLTSSDILDTCLAVQLDRAGALLADGVDAVAGALKRRAFEHRSTLCVGRSHGVHAEPTSFGLKLAGHYAEFARAAERLTAARREIATCAISGPVGTFASVDPAVEAHVAAQMGLAPEPVSTQVIRATATPCISPCSASSPAPSSGWRSRSGTCNAARLGRRPRLSARAKKVLQPCPTRRTRS